MADPQLGPYYGYSPEPPPEDPNAPTQSFEPAGPPLPPVRPPATAPYTPAFPAAPSQEDRSRYAQAVLSGARATVPMVSPLGTAAGEAGGRALSGVSAEKIASIIPHTEDEKRAFAKKVLAGVGGGIKRGATVAGEAISKASGGAAIGRALSGEGTAPAAGKAATDDLAPPPRAAGAVDAGTQGAGGVDATAYRLDYPKIASTYSKGGWRDIRAPQVKLAEEEQQQQGHAAADTIYGAREQARVDTEADLRRSIAETERRAAEQADAFNRLQSEATDQQKIAKTAHEAAEKFGSVSAGMASKSTPWRLAAGIFAGMGAFGAALTHTPNYALEVINKSLDDEVTAQRMRYQAAKDKAEAQDTIYGHVMARLNNEVQASQVTRAILTDKARALGDLAAQREQGAANKEQQQKLDMLLEQQKVNDLKEAFKNIPSSRSYIDPRTGAPITATQVFELANSSDKTNLALAEVIMKNAAEAQKAGKDETNKQLQYGVTRSIEGNAIDLQQSGRTGQKVLRDLESTGGKGVGPGASRLYGASPFLFSLAYGDKAQETQQDINALKRAAGHAIDGSALSPDEKKSRMKELDASNDVASVRTVAQRAVDSLAARNHMVMETMTDPEARRRFQEMTGGGGAPGVPPGFSK